MIKKHLVSYLWIDLGQVRLQLITKPKNLVLIHSGQPNFISSSGYTSITAWLWFCSTSSSFRDAGWRNSPYLKHCRSQDRTRGKSSWKLPLESGHFYLLFIGPSKSNKKPMGWKCKISPEGRKNYFKS